jgi:hypothetical protein
MGRTTVGPCIGAAGILGPPAVGPPAVGPPTLGPPALGPPAPCRGAPLLDLSQDPHGPPHESAVNTIHHTLYTLMDHLMKVPYTLYTIHYTPSWTTS